MEAELREEAQGFARAVAAEAGAPWPACTAQRTAIRVEDVVQHPLPGYTVPVAFAFSPDDALVTCLWSPEGTLTRQLYAFDPATRAARALLSPVGGGVREATLSHEEKLRRERARERGLGVSRYAWAKKAQRLLVPDPTAGLLVLDGGGPAEAACAVPAAPGAPPMLDPQLSPDGAKLLFLRDGDLFVAPATPADGAAQPVQLTLQLTFRDGAATVTHGLAEYIAQEEMQRAEGAWWSPDSASVAFCAVDDAAVARYRIPHWAADPAAEEVHAYPFAGTANARVRLGVVRVPSLTAVAAARAPIVWLDVDCGSRESARPDEEYLARVAWSADSTQVLAQLQDRAQRTLAMVALDAATGARLRTVLTERGEPWVNLSDCWKPLEDGSVLWSSERTGFRHLYLYARGKEQPEVVTAGEWAVDALEGVDEKRGVVFFSGTLDSPLERHLYAAPLRCGERAPPRRLTPGAGVHNVKLDHGFARFVDVHDAPDAPPRVSLRSLSDGAELLRVWDPLPLRAARLGLTLPEFITLTAADGTALHGAVFKPLGAGPWPLVVSVYGGPHVQTVSRSWAQTVDMRAQLLRSRGFAVLKLDGRGSARRGLAFEASLHLRMGSVELEDQVMGVERLVADGVADARRVGCYGWSYGGYLAALAALRHPRVFRAAVAGAPVTSWDGYDTHYTERYMGLPHIEARAYEDASAMRPPAPGDAPPSPLLLIHGMLDENVHFRHTARLVAALTQRLAPHELMLFPEERHLPRGEEGRAHAERRALAFLERELKMG